MEGSVGDNEGTGCGEVVGVEGLTQVGITRHHSVPLVKLVTAAAASSSSSTTTLPPDPLAPDVIIPDVITTPLSDVIVGAADGVTIRPVNDVTLDEQKASSNIKDEDGQSLSSRATKIITVSTTTSTSSSSLTNTTSTSATTTATYQLEPDWREAACEPVLTVRCKKITAELVKAKFGSGSRGKCIIVGKEWFTPTEFEAHCGRSASKDWKRSIRFQGQSLLTLIAEGYLQVHATSCSCGACLDDDVATGSIRLHRPYKRKKKDQFFLGTKKELKHVHDHTDSSSTTPTTTVTLPVSGLGELTVVPQIVLEEQHTPDPTSPQPPPSITASVAAPPTIVDPATLPLDKAWEHMNEVLLGLERSVSEARMMLGALRERTQQEGLSAQQKLLREKEEAVNQAKLEAQISSMAKSSEEFLVQVHDDEGSPTLQPIMLDSLISNVPSGPSLAPIRAINGVQIKCVNCNRESKMECSGCQTKAYCSEFCQRRDWVNHQAECGRNTPDTQDHLTVSQPHSYIFMLSD